ncbi:MAG TPA: ABC transporter substrate-binding protein, partial [Micromonosporaceae bacterium]|nr:ABC transporter substrate-binding protein [Micromonosporaceae bacterium]
MSRRPRSPQVCLGVLSATALVLSACTADTPSASGDPAGTSLVIAVAEEPASLHPLAGFAEHGAARIYDGLVEHRADGSVRPVLAEDLPEPAPDGRSWTARLRHGVTFTDGTAFDAADVVATYAAILNPAYASSVRQRFAVLTAVTQVDTSTVRFDLAQPYAPFLDLLVLGIVPSQSLATPAPVTAGPPPPGTGPYRLTEWRPGTQLSLEANESYFDGAPKIRKVTVEFLPDDDTRAARMRDGKLDGAALPPRLARAFDGAGGIQVVGHGAADLRAVRLPDTNPVTADPALRLALNYGVNRKALVEGPLAGKGTSASTPVPPVLAEFVEPAAEYPYDVTKALDTLAEAGWLPGPDGTRTRAGVPAAFTLLYPVRDSISRELATAFATAAQGIGVRVEAKAADHATLTARAGQDAALAAFGNPFDPDFGLYQQLRGKINPTADAALDTGHTASDPA